MEAISFFDIIKAVQVIADSLCTKKKLMTMGSQSKYISNEITAILPRSSRSYPIPLNTNTTVFKSGFIHHVYSSQVEIIGKRRDCLLAISYLGNEDSLRLGFIKAREMGIKTIGLLGSSRKCPLFEYCDYPIILPIQSGIPTILNQHRINEAYTFILNMMVELMRQYFLD